MLYKILYYTDYENAKKASIFTGKWFKIRFIQSVPDFNWNMTTDSKLYGNTMWKGFKE